MARRPKIHVGVEIGTSKTCVAVGRENDDSSVTIIGMGITKSVGIRKGEIVDFSKVNTCLKDAIIHAENISNTRITLVNLAVTGSHLHGVNSSGACLLDGDRSPILDEHITAATINSYDIKQPEGSSILHRIVRNYDVDGSIISVKPIGRIANRLAVFTHSVLGINSRLENSIKVIREYPLDITNIVFSPIAASLIALNKEDKDNGALLIDIGGGTTDYVLFIDGAMVASGCIPVGGDHVTNDIFHSTGLSFSKAEKLKIMEGNASPDPLLYVGEVTLVDENGFADITVSKYKLNSAIRDRLEEILIMLRDRLPENAMKSVKTGVFVTGGTSQTRGMASLVEEIFGCPMFIADYSEKSSTDHPSYKDPRFTTVLGLIRYSQIIEEEQSRDGFFSRLLSRFWPLNH